MEYTYRDTQMNRIMSLLIIGLVILFISVEKSINYSQLYAISFSLIGGIMAFFMFSHIDNPPITKEELLELVDYAENYEENNDKVLGVEYIE